ncbi:MAG: hypothetical protein JSV98_10715, partial [candidate division WOR-3 bacterium]
KCGEEIGCLHREETRRRYVEGHKQRIDTMHRKTLRLAFILFLMVLFVSYCEKENSAIKQRSYLMYRDLALVLMFDSNDSLDGFAMVACPDSIKSEMAESDNKNALIPCLGAFGIRFNDHSTRVVELLGEPTSEKEPEFQGQPKDLKLEMMIWQNADTSLIVNFANDSVTKIDAYLKPFHIPYSLEWRAHKDSVTKILGEPQLQGQFTTKLPVDL